MEYKKIILFGIVIFIIFFGLVTWIVLVFANFGWHGGANNFFMLIPLAIVALLVWGLISLFSNKPDEGNKKAYKSEEIKESMRVQYLFYIGGIIFVFIAVWYFAREYVAQFPRSIKLVLLLVSMVVSYIVAEFMRESDI